MDSWRAGACAPSTRVPRYGRGGVGRPARIPLLALLMVTVYSTMRAAPGRGELN